jgi:uncharacterized membrane protein (UPF0127 family)
VEPQATKIRGYAVALAALAALAALSASACAGERSEPAKPAVVLHAAPGAVRVTVEVVATPAARSLGLMHRKELAADAGMLFVFDETAPHTFWMRNTPLSLDMIFIGEDRRIVGIVERAAPYTTTPRGVDAPSRYVLEVNGGFSERHGVRPGDPVTFERVREIRR